MRLEEADVGIDVVAGAGPSEFMRIELCGEMVEVGFSSDVGAVVAVWEDKVVVVARSGMRSKANALGSGVTDGNVGWVGAAEGMAIGKMCSSNVTCRETMIFRSRIE